MEVLPSSVLTEARAEIVWGRDAESVVTLLREHGASEVEAREILSQFLDERAVMVRRNGIRTILWGAGCMVLPAINLLLDEFSRNFFNWEQFLFYTVVLGFFGVGLTLYGLLMFLLPRSYKGDLSKFDLGDERDE